jgi:hypothetical protein
MKDKWCTTGTDNLLVQRFKTSDNIFRFCATRTTNVYATNISICAIALKGRKVNLLVTAAWDCRRIGNESGLALINLQNAVLACSSAEVLPNDCGYLGQH